MEVTGLTNTIIETGKKKYTIKSEKSIDLPRWLASFLEKEGIVEIITHDNKYYQRMIQEEKKKRDLHSLDSNFYDVAEMTIKKADTDYKRKLVLSLRELIELRMEKLMKLALQNGEIEAPHHEKILYNRIRKEINDWKKNIEEICNGD